MADYLDHRPEEETVPRKLMAFVGFIAVFGAISFGIALVLNHKHPDPNIDPTDPQAFEQTDASEEETPDLWVQKRPWDDANAPQSKTVFQKPDESKQAEPTSSPS